MQTVDNVFAHYGVKPNFTIRYLPTIDLLPLVPNRSDWLAKLIFALQLVTFALVAFFMAMVASADIYFSRDPRILSLLSLIKPKKTLIYEAHQLTTNPVAQRIQRLVVRRCGSVIAVTEPLKMDLATLSGMSPETMLVAHDGIRASRFTGVPDRTTSRARLGWAQEAFIVGYVGRLQTMAQDKGLATLVRAIALCEDVSLAIVGGPDEMVEVLRTEWEQLGLTSGKFLATGQVLPDEVPAILASFDVGANPLPAIRHFSRHASPLKLFEYMASGCAVITSNMPGWADVVHDRDNALLVPPGDIEAFAAAIRLLQHDAALRERLSDNARTRVFEHYTWAVRAQRILDFAQSRGT
jgi:glycosyltransferase involved in cell wall biosynthesis